MSRLPFLRRDALSDDGVDLWDGIVETRGAAATNDAGGLIGPFNAWVTAPGVGARLSSLGATLRFETSIDRRLLEVAIITTGAAWKAEFEWWAHSQMARDNGVTDAVVDAIGRGDTPPFERDDERVVYDVARQLSSTGKLDQAVFNAGRELLGDQGMVELVSLCGYYVLVSFTLNAFAVGLPPGARPAFDSA
jgi:4-carboxymuconolactone decarboxylase